MIGQHAPTLALVALSALLLAVRADIAVAADPDPWPGLVADIFGARQIIENDQAFSLHAPENAEDAALVPVTIRMPPDVANQAKSLTLIVDRNPAPVAATFRFGEAYKAAPEVGERIISTRLRVESFAKVRAVLETADGRLHMAARFVAGSGGCSGQGVRDHDEAIAQLGAVKVDLVSDSNREPAWREGTVMIRHPNFTGMQLNSKGTYTPARFVDVIEVKRGDELLFRVDGGISIAENPHIRFNLAAAPGENITLFASDIDGATFHGQSMSSGS
jgi:sulfur-oxidizing protein SoxY